MYRYRDPSGSTWHSKEKVERHLHKVGIPLYVRGYIHIGRYGKIHRVLVKGTRGEARFNGFSWGYGGTGPHGLEWLLLRMGVDKALAEKVAFTTPWVDGVGEHWRINFKLLAEAA